MSKVSDYVEAQESVKPDGGWLFIAELQSDGSYITKKISPHNVGAIGPTGPQGLPGNSGANGTNGANGAPGANGANGLRGTQWFHGVGAPSNAIGENGDFYYQTDTGPVVWGPKSGAVWILGINIHGTDGRTVLNGNVNPVPGDGVDGDFYINTATNFIFGPKMGGAWPAGVSLVGPAGATGATGASGAPAASELRNSDGFAVEFFDDYSLGAISSFDKGLGFANNGVASGGTIVSKTMVSGQVHNRLQIITGQYGRKMPWGNDWGRIILAVLVRINRGSTFTGGANFMGICSGTTNMVASGTTDNFIGIKSGQNANDFIFTAGTRMSFFNHNPTWRFVSRRGVTTTDRTSGSGSAGRNISANEGYLSIHVMEIGRPTFLNAASSITYSFGRHLSDDTQVEMSLAKTILLDALRDPTTSTVGSGTGISSLTGGANNTTSYAFDESTGELDTINISWIETFGLEIAAIGVRKVW